MQVFEKKEISRQSENEIVQLVSFYIGNEFFGVSILTIQEIIRMTSITPIPNSPDFIEGVINLRGKVIPVVDMRRRLNIEPSENMAREKARILVIEVTKRVIGFIVDSVSKVIKISTDTIEPPPDIVIAGVESEYIKGVSKLNDNEMFILLDFEKIFSTKEVQTLKETEIN